MDIGTAKPDLATRAACRTIWSTSSTPTRRTPPHDFAPTRSRRSPPFAHAAAPRCSSAARCFTSRRCAKGCRSLPGADAGIRARLDARAAAEGWPALHAELARASIRSLRRGSSPPTASASSARSRSMRSRDGRCRRCMARATPGRSRARSLLRWFRRIGPNFIERIARRFDAMLAAGLVDELRALRERFALRPDLPSMRCVGYRQAWQFLDGVGDPRPCASAASPRPDNWPSASSPGCGRLKRRCSIASTTSIGHIASAIAAEASTVRRPHAAVQ